MLSPITQVSCLLWVGAGPLGQPATLPALVTCYAEIKGRVRADSGRSGGRPFRVEHAILAATVINFRNNQLQPSDLLDDRTPLYSSPVSSPPLRPSTLG